MRLIKEWDEFENEEDEHKYDNRGREIVALRDIAHSDSHAEDSIDGFQVVEEEQVYYDGEKGYIELNCVIQRESDGKYFKFSYTRWPQGNGDLKRQVAHEVKRKERMVYYYD